MKALLSLTKGRRIVAATVGASAHLHVSLFQRHTYAVARKKSGGENVGVARKS